MKTSQTTPDSMKTHPNTPKHIDVDGNNSKRTTRNANAPNSTETYQHTATSEATREDHTKNTLSTSTMFSKPIDP